MRAQDTLKSRRFGAGRGEMQGRALKTESGHGTEGPGFGWVCSVFAATLLVYALLTPRVLRYLEPPLGDQPHYLMTTISIAEDHDLDEFNNYHESASYKEFYTVPDSPSFKGIRVGPLTAGFHSAPRANRPTSEWYSMHGPGLPVLIVPGWAIGQALKPLLGTLTANGNGGWPGTVFEMNLLGALVAVQVFLLAWDVTRSRAIGMAVWAPVTFANPLMSFSYLIFPELPAALATIYAFRRLRLGWTNNRRWQLMLVALGIGALPWLQIRFAPISLGLFAFAVYQWWHAPERASRTHVASLALLVGTVSVAGGCFVTYMLWLYGELMPKDLATPAFFTSSSSGRLFGMDWESLYLAALGLLYDRQYGLLVYAPVFILVLVGLYALWRVPGTRAQAGWLVGITLPYTLVVAHYSAWWGGLTPPARYLTAIIPLSAVPLAYSLCALRTSSVYRTIYAVSSAITVVIMVALLAGLDHPPGLLPALLNEVGSSDRASLFAWISYWFPVDPSSLVPQVAPWFSPYRHHLVPLGPILGCLALSLAILLPGLIAVDRIGEPPMSAASAAPPASARSAHDVRTQ